MKSLRSYCAILLTLVFSVGLIYQTFTIVYFYSNQAEITEKYCVNKEKPEKKCHGKCHLEKQLSVNTDQKNPDTKVAVQPISFWFFAVEFLQVLRLEYFDFSSSKDDILLVQKIRKSTSFQFVPPDFC